MCPRLVILIAILVTGPSRAHAQSAPPAPAPTPSASQWCHDADDWDRGAFCEPTEAACNTREHKVGECHEVVGGATVVPPSSPLPTGEGLSCYAYELPGRVRRTNCEATRITCEADVVVQQATDGGEHVIGASAEVACSRVASAWCLAGSTIALRKPAGPEVCFATVAECTERSVSNGGKPCTQSFGANAEAVREAVARAEAAPPPQRISSIPAPTTVASTDVSRKESSHRSRDDAERGLPAFYEPHVDLGFVSMNSTMFESSGVGFHLQEWNGMITKVLLGAPIALAFAATVERNKITNFQRHWSPERTWTTSSRIDPGCEFNCSGISVETTHRTGGDVSYTAQVTPVSPAKIAAQLKERDDWMAGFSLLPMDTDLLYLPNRDDGRLHGIRGSFYVFALPIGLIRGLPRSVQIATGYYGDRLHGTVMENGMPTPYLHRARGIPIRLVIAPARWLVLQGELLNNLLGVSGTAPAFEDFSSTLIGSAAVSIPGFERLFFKIGVEKTGVTGNGKWGTWLEGGMRF